MMEDKSIILVGPMGAGKTSVGRLLAKKLRRNFVDLDAEIEAQTGARIDDIFNLEGEAGFRRRETAMLKKLAAMKNIVLATGGGAVLRPENRDLILQAGGSVIYLQAAVEALVKRLEKSKNRPLLNQTENRKRTIRDIEKTIRDILGKRENLYREVANTVVDTTNKKPATIVSEI